MLELLAQTTSVPDDAGAKWYAGVMLIIFAGVAGIVLIMGLMIIFRMNRRWQARIERDIAERRANRTPTTDLWKESAQRYVDPDALSEQERAERQGGAGSPPVDDYDDPDPPFDDDPTDELPPDAPFGGQGGTAAEDDDDPYGLFKDKPYTESDEMDDDDEGYDDEEDGPDEDEEDKPF